MIVANAQFSIGDKIEHQLFGYRGVVLDVDTHFQLSEEWYEKNPKAAAPKDAPWYHVLVHDTAQMAYVAEVNLAKDESSKHIDHPIVSLCFDKLAGGRYQRRGAMQ